MMIVPATVRLFNATASLLTGDAGPWLEHLTQDENLTVAEARDVLRHYEVIPYIDPKFGHMGTFIKRNKEIHFALYRRFRRPKVQAAQRMRDFLQEMLTREVFLVTKVAKDEDASFIEHLGFEPLGVTLDGALRTYILNDIKAMKRHPHEHH
jgi:hypothetical protein